MPTSFLRRLYQSLTAEHDAPSQREDVCTQVETVECCPSESRQLHTIRGMVAADSKVKLRTVTVKERMAVTTDRGKIRIEKVSSSVVMQKVITRPATLEVSP